MLANGDGISIGSPTEASGNSDYADLDDSYTSRHQPVLEKFCYSCHGEKRSRGGLELHGFTDTASVLSEPEVWTTVRERLELREMPPSRNDQPSDAERTDLILWITDALERMPCEGEPQPGRVTLRRLNRIEYQNTVRDLFGIDIHLIDEFPADDSGYGFDNIGDVLTLPSLLMERYLAAAERIAQTVIIAPEPAGPTHREWAATQFEQKGNGRAVNQETRGLFSRGEIARQVRFPSAGEYTLHIVAWGQQAGPEAAKMAVLLDGKRIAMHNVEATANEPGTYTTTITVSAGIKTLALRFLNDYYAPKHKDPGMRGDRNLFIRQVRMDMPPAVADVQRDAHERIMICEPADDPASVRDCAQRIVAQLAERAFRRPLRAEEVERYASLVELVVNKGESFERGIQVAIQSILVSPYFLFLVEDVPPSADLSTGVYSLDDYALASRLSYFLWSTMPDETLFRLASENRLHDDAVLEAQVRRMLADPRSEALVENFAGQWLEIRKLADIKPDPQHFPDFDETLRRAMREESEALFRHIMREDRSILDFLISDYTFMNERLAKHYGVPEIEGEQFRLVSLEGKRPGGVITHAGVLTLTSDPTRTSPVKRGKWVLEQILGTPPPPPPPDVPALPEAAPEPKEGEAAAERPEELTLRQRLEVHLIRDDCRSCHNRMDPIGLGLENFNAIGAWRDREGTHPIDASGSLPDGASFDGPEELIALLAEKSHLFRICLTEKMLTYALGRGLEYNDRCTVQAVCEKLESNGDRFSTLIVEIVKSAPFRLRALPEDDS